MQFETLFWQGDYQSIIVGFRQGLSSGPADLSYVVGAFAFVGELETSLAIFDSSFAPLSDSDQLPVARSRFFLGVNLIRGSRYRQGTEMLALNARLMRRLSSRKARDSCAQQSRENLEISFYVHQGAAFQRYCQTRFDAAQTSAQRALMSSVQGGLIYGQVLALDLLAHCLMRTGKGRMSIRNFDRALVLAELIGNGGLRDAIEISKVLAMSTLGLLRQNALSTLQDQLDHLEPQDTYSRVETLLEAISQALLLGNGTAAEQYFHQAGEIVFLHEQHRQQALYHLRHASLERAKGNLARALAIAEGALQKNPSAFELEIQRLGEIKPIAHRTLP